MSVSAIVLRNHVEIKNIDEEEEEQEETQRQNFGLSRIALKWPFFISRVLFSPQSPTSELRDRQLCRVVVTSLHATLLISTCSLC